MNNQMKNRTKLTILAAILLTALIVLPACNKANKSPKTYYFNDGIEINTDGQTPDTEPAQQYKYSQDFSQKITAGNPDWYINEMADISGGQLTSSSGHPYLALKHKARAEKVTMTLDLKANRPGAMTNDSAYIALRLNNYDDQFAAVGQNGLWLAFQNSKVGIINTWPTVTLIPVGIRFDEGCKIYLEDNQKDNVITVYAEEADGEKTLAFTLTITDSRKVVLTDRFGKDRIKTTFKYDIPNNGHMALWAHQNNGGVTFDNVEVSWEECGAMQYVPTDPDTIVDLYSDTWVGMDDEKRLVNYGAGDVDDKLVGIFYQIWHVSASTTYPDQITYDHHAIYQKGGHAAVKEAYTKGPEGWGHYWGQPYFGYYLTNDRWVIRKHASMLSDIGIDFIFLDVTNGNPLTSSYMTIFKEYKAMRDEGMKTPDICFFLAENAELNPKVFDDIWENIYSTGMYSDLYAMYKGKPLILGNMEKIDNKEALEMFTVRRCWALEENVNGGKDMWTWMHESPQPVSTNTATGEKEEISISAGILANTSSGRSNVNGVQPPLITLPDGTKDIFQFELPTTGKGLFFNEQMEYAAQADTQVLLITSWNEWGAGRWEGTIHPKIANTMIDWTYDFYVDCFNPEFSRDVEPMTGGFGDNYYYQLAQFLRSFNGSRPAPQAAGVLTDNGLDAPLEAWNSVWPEYLDTRGDTYHRDALGHGGFYHYKNDSGRNDIISAKVSKTANTAYFLAVCADTITAPEGNNWMNLFINTDCNYDTGWYGYDIVINRDSGMAADGKVSVEKFIDNSWKTEPLAEGEIGINGNYLVIKVDTGECGLTGDFDFKWADNSTENGDIMQFLDLGDSAPNARFNYAYRAQAGEATFNDELAKYLKGGAAFDAGKSYMAADNSIFCLFEPDTNAKAKMHLGRLFSPVTALGNIKGSSVTVSEDGRSATWKTGKKTIVFTADSTEVKVGVDTCIIPVAPFIENGVIYVPLNAAAFVADLNYYAQGGAAIITPEEKSPTETIYNQISYSF